MLTTSETSKRRFERSRERK